MVDAPPTAVGVRPVDCRGSLVTIPRLRTRALGDEFEANCGAWSRALDCTGTAALHARRCRVRPATAAAISHPWRNGAAPRGAIRPCRRGDREWQQRTGSGGNFRVFRSNSNSCVFNCTCRDFVPIHIFHLSQPALSTRYCHFAPAWNRPVPRPLHLKSESLQPVFTTPHQERLRGQVAGCLCREGGGSGQSRHGVHPRTDRVPRVGDVVKRWQDPLGSRDPGGAGGGWAGWLGRAGVRVRVRTNASGCVRARVCV
jgi:hypothetical protein